MEEEMEEQRREQERIQEEQRREQDRREQEAQRQRDQEEFDRQQREQLENDQRKRDENKSTLETMNDFSGGGGFDEQFAVNRYNTVKGVYEELSLTSRFLSRFVPESWTHAGRIRQALNMSQRMMERQINGNELGEHTNDAKMSPRERVLSDYKKTYSNCAKEYAKLNVFQKFMGAVLPNSWTKAGKIRTDIKMNDMFLKQKTLAFSPSQIEDIKKMEEAKLQNPEQFKKPNRAEALREYKMMNNLVNAKNRNEIKQTELSEEKGWVNMDTTKTPEQEKNLASEFEQPSLQEFIDLDGEIKKPKENQNLKTEIDLSELAKLDSEKIDSQQVLPEENMEEIQGKNGGEIEKDQKSLEKDQDFFEQVIPEEDLKGEKNETDELSDNRDTIASENDLEGKEMDDDEFKISEGFDLLSDSYKESDATQKLQDELRESLNEGPRSSRELYEQEMAMTNTNEMNNSFEDLINVPNDGR